MSCCVLCDQFFSTGPRNFIFSILSTYCYRPCRQVRCVFISFDAVAVAPIHDPQYNYNFDSTISVVRKNDTQKGYIITFCVTRRRRKMYCGHPRLRVCLCVCLSAAACPHYCTDPDVTWSSGRRCPLVVHCWADLQSVYGLRCYGNITRTLVTCLRPSRDMTT